MTAGQPLPTPALPGTALPGTTPAPGSADSAPDAAPLLSVTSGQPTAEELAAVTAVVLALTAGAATPEEAPATRQWARRANLRLDPTPGPNAWRRSAR